MKLLFAIKHLDGVAGGAERVLCTVCSDLVARGHDVSIVTFDEPGGGAFYDLDPRVRCADLAIGNASSSSSFLDTIRRAIVLRRHIHAEKPDVAIGFMHSMFIPLAFSLIGVGVPVLGSEHIVPEHYKSRRFQFFLLRLSARVLDKMTVLSESIRETYPSDVMGKMVVMPNPIKKPQISDENLNKATGQWLLNVGRLDEQKDQATLIKAFAQIASDFPSWKLKIIGMGPLLFDLQDLAKAMGLRGRVIFQSVTSEIDKEYRTADIFVISSRYEAFGLVTAEAMSHGVPVVGFADCAGTNELIQNGETGVLVDPQSDRVTQLASALSNLMKNHVMQKKLGGRGKLVIETQYSSAHVCDQWEKLLLELARK